MTDLETRLANLPGEGNPTLDERIHRLIDAAEIASTARTPTPLQRLRLTLFGLLMLAAGILLDRVFVPSSPPPAAPSKSVVIELTAGETLSRLLTGAEPAQPSGFFAQTFKPLPEASHHD